MGAEEYLARLTSSRTEESIIGPTVSRSKVAAPRRLWNNQTACRYCKSFQSRYFKCFQRFRLWDGLNCSKVEAIL
eukprot:1279124-Pleurochrysis_carterae.AAC.1